jgi:hypothetical protein
VEKINGRDEQLLGQGAYVDAYRANGLVLWRFSDAGPAVRGTVVMAPASETLTQADIPPEHFN